jgi:hypothetical protein
LIVQGIERKQPTSEVLRILHGARGLPPAEAAEALRPFLESMRKSGSDDALARASIAAVTELARSLKENHAASDDLWQEAIEPHSALQTRQVSREGGGSLVALNLPATPHLFIETLCSPMLQFWIRDYTG